MFLSCTFLSIFHIVKVQITFASFFKFFVKILRFSLDFYIVSFVIIRNPSIQPFLSLSSEFEPLF